MSSTRTLSGPCSSASRKAAALRASRVATFLRSRSPSPMRTAYAHTTHVHLSGTPRCTFRHPEWDHPGALGDFRMPEWWMWGAGMCISWCRGGGHGGGQRDADVEGRPARHGLHANVTVMLVDDDPPRDVQAEAGAFAHCLRGEEGFEDAALDLGRD